MKYYVTETTERNSDGDKLQVVKVMESKPNKLSYVIFVDK